MPSQSRRPDLLYVLVLVFATAIPLAYSSVFYQCFFTAKLILIYGLATACVLALSCRDEIRLPSRKLASFLGTYVVLAALLGLTSTTPHYAWMQVLFLCAGAIFYVATINLTEPQQGTALNAIFFLGNLESILLALQAGHLAAAVLPAPLIQEPTRLSGTIGNPEFAATLLGVAGIIGVQKFEQASSRRIRGLALFSILLLLVGIALTRNKGTLLLLGVYFVWKRHRNPRWITGLAVIGLGAVALLSPDSLKGRLFLWLASTRMFFAHFWRGVGLSQFESNYLATVHDLFAKHPSLLAHFGGFTSTTLDAHNIFLQHAAELGVLGLILSVVFFIYSWKLATAQTHYLSAALIFLLCKSLYTVVLNSPTSMILLALILGILAGQDDSIRWKPSWQVTTPIIAVSAALFTSGIGFSMSDYWYQQGIKQQMLGDDSGAIAALNRASQTNPDNSDAYLGLAYVNFMEKKPAPMDAYIRRAIASRRNMDTYKISAHMYYYSGLYAPASELYEYILSVFPEHLTSMAKLAVISQENHDERDAIMLAKRVLATHSRRKNDSDARNLEIARRVLERAGETAIQ